jgi:hypothetical protein
MNQGKEQTLSVLIPRGQRFMSSAALLACAIILILSGASGVGQTAPTAKPIVTDSEIAATTVKITTLRDAFVKAAVDAGFTCPIAPPTILVVDVPAFGDYDRKTNTLKIVAWNQMTAAEKNLFYQFLGPGTNEAAARAEFEEGVHHWVFVHELGHWWQACRGVVDGEEHYKVEFGADRIAAAYWREHDPEVVAHQRAVFETVLGQSPNPVPEGQRPEAYFDENYAKLGPTPAYIWFQARMSISAFDEKPAPAFAQALQQTAH